MLASDVCLVCVHTEQETIDAVAGEDGLLAIGPRGMADKARLPWGEGGKASMAVYMHISGSGRQGLSGVETFIFEWIASCSILNVCRISLRLWLEENASS